MNQQRISIVIAILSIFFMLMINIAILTSITQAWKDSLKDDLSSRKHISYLKEELSIGYLWLTEYINGDSSIDIQKDILLHFDNAQDKNIDFVKVMTNVKHNQNKNKNESEIVQEFNKIHNSIVNMKEMALYRLSHIDSDSKNHTKFDNDFKKLFVKLRDIDNKIEKHFEHGLAYQDINFSNNAIFLLAVNGLMFLILFLTYRTHKKYESDISEQKKVFEILFQKSSDGILLIENERVTDCNEAVLEMLKSPNVDEILNKRLSELSPAIQWDGRDSLAKMEEMIQICLEKGKHNFEWIHSRMDGENFWVEVALTALHIQNKEIIHVSWRNISQRKALEASLQQKSQLYKKLNQELDTTVKQQSAHLIQQSRLAQMGEMISMIAHQWRQPLASISTITGTLNLSIVMEQFDKEKSLKKLESISEISQHLSSTIDVFRSFFKEDKNSEVFTLSEIIDSCMDIIGPLLTSKNIILKSNIDDTLFVKVPPNEFKQVILNFLKNAEDVLVDRNISEPYIWIDVYEKDSMVHLSIEDNAGGIPEDIIEKIFDPYFTTKSLSGGTGLGLYMSKIILEEHCKSRYLVKNTSRGAQFEIIMPLNKNITNKEN